MSPELARRGPPSLLHAPALAWPAIAGCVGLAALALAAPALGLHGLGAGIWRLWFVAASLWRLGAARRYCRAELGLVWQAAPSARFWIWAAIWMAGAVLLAFAAAAALSRRGIDPLGLCAARAPWSALRAWVALVSAPLAEETLFRLLLCGALAGRISAAANVAVSGAAFAGAHAVFGGIGPDSLVGGFLLAWAFLRSGTIAVPIALHALGNAALLLLLASPAFRAAACSAAAG